MQLGTLKAAIRATKGPITFRAMVPAAGNIREPAYVHLALAKNVLLSELTDLYGKKNVETGMTLTDDGLLVNEDLADTAEKPRLSTSDQTEPDGPVCETTPLPEEYQLDLEDLL